jgi:hypothetical protein
VSPPPARLGLVIVAGHDLVLPARRLARNGLEAWAQVLERDYEGYIGKDETSQYLGGKTTSWLKVKVPGWTDPEDRWKRVRLKDSRARFRGFRRFAVGSFLRRETGSALGFGA